MTKKKSEKKTFAPLTIASLKENRGDVATHQVGVRFTEAEFAETLAKAKETGHRSLSNYVRHMVGLSPR